jgi:steroid 5-alpha reductase family enzyme
VTLWFLLSLAIKRNDVADIAWGLGFVVASFAGLYKTQNFTLTALITASLVLVWGVRLSWHIGSRNIRKSEDYRYKAWRDDWGKWFVIRSYLQVFILQGFLMLVIVLPVLIIHTYSKDGLMPLTIIGVAIWLFGFVFESIGDKQLKNFLSNPDNKGKMMTSGLWQYTRHPNYFGEVTQWWAIGVIALSWQYGWLGLIGPAVITFLIVKVSGVPLLEKKYADNPEYQAYKKRTSMLIPLPAKDN